MTPTSPLFKASWLTVVSLPNNKQDILTTHWNHNNKGETILERSNLASISTAVPKIAARIKLDQGIPLIPFGRNVMVFDCYDGKYSGCLVSPNGSVEYITKPHSSFKRCMKNSFIKANKKNATVLILDSERNYHVIEFDKGYSRLAPNSNTPIAVFLNEETKRFIPKKITEK